MAYTTIDDPSAYFKVQLYTGNGSANHAITFDDTDTDMQPDFVWIKNRDAGDSNCLFDAVRGATEVLHSDTTAAEATDADTLDSFASDGFQVDADVKVNTNAEDYVAWCWKAGTTSGLSGGTITPSSYSINTTSGLGIYKWTGNSTSGATIAHGLGVVPKMIIIKRTETTAAWMVFHEGIGNGNYLSLDTNAAAAVSASAWNDTSPTSTLFSLGDGGNVNNSSGTYIGYVFAPVQGFSKVGSYVGNGNADGPFVYTGFRPAFVLIKKTSGAGSWWLFDNKRIGYNANNYRLFPDTTGVEDTTAYLDLVSNGFKIRNTDGDINFSGSTLHYMAFAEAPFVNSNGVPCNAR